MLSHALIFHKMNDAAIIFDDQSVIQEINGATEKILGWASSELVGLKVVDLLEKLKVDAPSKRKILGRIQERESWSGEVEFSRRDGETFLGGVTGFPVPQVPGDQVGYAATITDLFGRNQVGLAARRNENEPNDANPELVGHWQLDAAERQISLRGTLFERLFPDLSEAGERFETVLASVFETDRDCVRDACDQALATGLGFDEIFRAHSSDQKLRHIRVCGEPLIDDDANIVGLAGTAQDITDEVLSEKKMANNQRLYSAAARYGRTAPWEVFLQEREFIADETMSFVLGMEGEAPPLTLDEWARYLAPSDYLRVVGALRRVAEGKDDKIAVEFSISGENGGPRWMLLQGEVSEFLDNGLPARLAGTTRDITAQKIAEEALRESEEQIRAILQNIAESVITVDEMGLILSTNEAFEKTFGYPAQELTGTHWSCFMAEPYRTRHAGEVEHLFGLGLGQRLGGGPQELQVIDKQGRSFPVELMMGEATIGDERLFIGSMRDISERKEADDKLREAAQVLGQIPDAVIITDTSGIVTTWAGGAERIYGYSPDETIGRHISLTLRDEDREEIERRTKNSIAGSDSFWVEGPRKRKSGELFYVHSSIRVLRNRNGEISGVMGVSYDATERKRAEDALRASEERYRSIVTALSEGIVFQNVQGEIIDWNSRAAEILGLPQDRLQGMAPGDFGRVAVKEDGGTVHPVDEYPAMVTLRTGEPCANVLMGVRHPEKGLRWLEMNSEPLFAEDASEPYSVVTSFVDITERKEAQKALQDSEERYALAAKLGRAASWEIYPEQDKILTDKNFMALLGEPDMDPPDRLDALLDTVHEDDLDHVSEALTAVFDGRAEQFSIEHRTRRTDGTIAWHRDEGYVASRPGKPRRVVGSSSDITQRKLAELELRKAQERLSTAQRIAGIGTWEAGLPSGGLYYSDEMFRILDLDPLSDLAMEWDEYSELIHDGDKDRVLSEVNLAAKGGEPFYVEYRIVTPRGREKTVLGFTEAHLDDDGTPVALAGTIQDITPLRQAEQQLHAARRMEVVGQLTGGIAHDFNNLLAIIAGNLELAQERVESDSVLLEMLQSGIDASRRGATLTKQLLAFSRRQNLVPQPTDIRSLTERMLDLSHRALGEAIEIVFEPGDGIWQVDVDPAQLENAFLNLAINARDAMSNGGNLSVRLNNFSATCVSESDPDALQAGDYAIIEVSDTGPGMTQEVRQKAFEPFFTTKDVGQGTGLGLSMVYGFVKQSGGHVEIESVLGEGTTVRMYLPRTPESASEVRDEAPDSLEWFRGDVGSDTVTNDPCAKDEASQKAGGEKTVLIVEDNPDVLHLAIVLVEKIGYRVVDASSAANALEVLEEHPEIDLILTDVILGSGINGVELANIACVTHPETKILLMSGYPREAIAEHGDAEKIYPLISKPFKMADLAQQMESLL